MAKKNNDFVFLRMWPRQVFLVMDGKKLAMKSVPELQNSGVYVLYRDDDAHYVGKASKLFQRLHDHANKMTDRYYPHWNYFSCFSFADQSAVNKKKIAEIEGILIASLPRVVNSATPRWTKIKIPKKVRTILKKAEMQTAKAMAAGVGF